MQAVQQPALAEWLARPASDMLVLQAEACRQLAQVRQASSVSVHRRKTEALQRAGGMSVAHKRAANRLAARRLARAGQHGALVRQAIAGLDYRRRLRTQTSRRKRVSIGSYCSAFQVGLLLSLRRR
jgi:hypothetical protein